ncbi:MAG: hypothetical protein ACRD3I_12985, partial [Terriglobales bacterium]
DTTDPGSEPGQLCRLSFFSARATRVGDVFDDADRFLSRVSGKQPACRTRLAAGNQYMMVRVRWWGQCVLW